MTEDISWFSVFMCAISVFFIYKVHSCDVEHDSPKYKALQEEKLKKCNTPKLVSQIDGVSLYVVSPDCDTPVYFSKSGTHTTHEEQHGKTVETVNDDVSNTEVGK